MFRGQELIVAALALPLMVMIFLAGFDVGRFQYHDYELNHAASEGAIIGASSPSERCANAKQAAIRILGRRPDAISCVSRARVIELTVAENLTPLSVVFSDPFPIRVTARAEIR
jgi:Flp pilus assembly protein TadG